MSSTNGIQRETSYDKGKKLGIVTSFEYMYLGAVVSHNGSNSDFLSRIAQASGALTKGMAVSRDSNIFLRSKMKLMPSLVISILYAFESGTFTGATRKTEIHPMTEICRKKYIGSAGILVIS